MAPRGQVLVQHTHGLEFDPQNKGEIHIAFTEGGLQSSVLT